MKRSLVVIIFIMAIASITNAQVTTHFELTPALISNNTRCISQDADGNIWIGTTLGITCYNGTTWTSYNTDNGLGNNLIYDIYCAPDGDVWAATAGGISVYNGIEWTVYTIGDGLPSNTIWCITGDSEGNIWGGTSTTGAFKFNSGVVTVYSTSNGLINNSVKTIFADRNGNVWMGTGSGLSKFDGASFRNFTSSNGLGGNLINDIIQRNNGDIAVATNGGVSFYNFSTWQTINTSNGLPNNSILGIAEDNHNVMYMGCSNGLFEYTNSTTYQLFTISNGLTSNIVNSLCIDNSEAVWAGSPFTGISYYNHSNLFIIYRSNRDLVDNHINQIYKDITGDIWVSTDVGLNNIHDMQWRTYTTNEGLVANDITCTYKDAAGVVWIGTTEGLTRMSGITMNQYTTGNGLTNDYVRAITSDGAGLIYVATQDKVTVFEGAAVIDTISTNDGLASNVVYNIYNDNNNRLWILCQDGITYRESNVFYDADVLPAYPVGRPLSIINNSAGGVVIGSDQYLYFFPNGITGASATNHPFLATNQAITSISQLAGAFLCSFENGSLYNYFASTWTAIPVADPLSYVFADPSGYTWYGYQEDGLDKICRTCTGNITATTGSFSCTSGTYPCTTYTITSPTGASNTYSMNGGSSYSASPVFNNVNPGFYHVMVKNAGVVVAEDYLYIDGPAGIGTSMTVGQIDCYGENDGWIELNNTIGYNFVWENGNSVLTLRENLIPGQYAVTVTNSAGCSLHLHNQIQQPAILSVGETHQNVACYGNSTGSIALTPSGGITPYSVVWSGSYSGLSISNLAAGTYYYTVTDVNGCNASGNVTITQPSQSLAVTGSGEAVDCFGDLGDITISVNGGTLPYTYHWNDNYSGGSRTNLPAGTYYLTVSDFNNCSITGSWQITQPSAPLEISDVDEVDVYCYEDATATIDVTVEGGTAPYSYSWTKNSVFYSTDEDLENLAIGVYHLVVTDYNGCSDATTVNISQSPPLQLEIDVTPITCPGYANGILFADVSGGSGIYSSFYWYNNLGQVIAVEQEFENVGPGTYTLIVTDSYYCTITDQVVVTEGEGHEIAMNITDASCFGSSSGSIQVVIDGGATTDVSYNWADGAAGNVATAINLAAGQYYVTITDSDGCESEADAEVNEPPMADLGVFPNNNEYRFCSGEQLTLDAGEGFLSYLWSTNAVSQTIPVNNGGTYTVIVEDEDGCVWGDTATVVVGEVFQEEELNLASVNEQNKVTLYWEKTPDVGTDYYNIYRKSGVQYTLYDQLDASLPAIYIDDDSDATTNTFSYKISSVDTCGNESALSDAHSSIYLLAQTEQYNQQVVCSLSYTPYEGFFVVYYYIMKGTSPTNLTVQDQNLYSEFEYIEFNPNPEGTYYQIMVRRLDGCYPGDGNYYDTAYSNIVFCAPYNAFESEKIENRVNVYPTVFEDAITIGFNLNTDSDVQLFFMNTLGQSIVYEEKLRIEAGEQQIKLHPNLAPGMYLIKLQIGDDFVTRKIIRR